MKLVKLNERPAENTLPRLTDMPPGVYEVTHHQMREEAEAGHRPVFLAVRGGREGHILVVCGGGHIGGNHADTFYVLAEVEELRYKTKAVDAATERQAENERIPIRCSVDPEDTIYLTREEIEWVLDRPRDGRRYACPDLLCEWSASYGGRYVLFPGAIYTSPGVLEAALREAQKAV